MNRPSNITGSLQRTKVARKLKKEKVSATRKRGKRRKGSNYV